MIHILFTLKGCPFGLLDDEAHIRNVLANAATLSESTLLDISSHKFSPMGITAIALLAEGSDPKFLLTEGWLSMGLKRFSLNHSFPTWLMPKSKEWNLDTNMGGEERAFVVTGEYEKVFPMDIYPQHLIKSIIVNDIDSMEKLGIYEVAPEDFALCEYGCTSKIPVQKLVREGLDNLRNELG